MSRSCALSAGERRTAGAAGHSEAALHLLAGELVEVRSIPEILASLDATGRRDALPFMPEMLQYAGKRFRVYKRADKACDTVGKTGARRMLDAVHLENVRCDGEAHGGCQAGCLIFWKEAWLKRVKETDESVAGREACSREGCSIDALHAATRAQRIEPAAGAPEASEELYRCQATELPRATSPLAWWDVRQYVRDVTSGNISGGELLYGFSVAGFNMAARAVRRAVFSTGRFLRRRIVSANRAEEARAAGTAPTGSPASSGGGPGLRARLDAMLDRLLAEYPSVRGRLRKTPSRLLNLQPGEYVRVRSKAEILETLDVNNRNRGLLFDAEMVPYCNGTYRVLRRVEKIVDEKTGRMLRLPTNCIVLEGVVCGGCLSSRRLFCPRSIYPYWHEIWLERS